MRTIKRISPKLNRGKFEALQEVASAYAREKQEHGPVYHDDTLFGAHSSERIRRDILVKVDKYISPHGVSGRMWKLAQKEAFEMVKKEWAALAEEIKPLIGAHKAGKKGKAPCGVVWTKGQLAVSFTTETPDKHIVNYPPLKRGGLKKPIVDQPQPPVPLG